MLADEVGEDCPPRRFSGGFMPPLQATDIAEFVDFFSTEMLSLINNYEPTRQAQIS
jgi:hypothetical protein